MLRVRAPLLIGVHEGSEIRRVEEWWGQSVSLDAVFFQPLVLEAELERAGFSVAELIERPPYPGVEVETNRIYVYARVGGDASRAQ